MRQTDSTESSWFFSTDRDQREIEDQRFGLAKDYETNLGPEITDLGEIVVNSIFSKSSLKEVINLGKNDSQTPLKIKSSGNYVLKQSPIKLRDQENILSFSHKAQRTNCAIPMGVMLKNIEKSISSGSQSIKLLNTNYRS